MYKVFFSLLLLILCMMTISSLPVEIKHTEHADDDSWYDSEIVPPENPECYKNEDCSFCCYNPETKVKLTVKRASCDVGLCQCLCDIF
ncbi:unnamed protein product [Bursaphelenchus okinawaensis]|uniref:Uncharacterized protein n=1 Tax=Bursaphelenchus okinawaensis TaxID=465554 RepID=A0A811KQ49_9BILA|nr:unnamed protein product [Bursaphelenchus okinawaensis]CAG9111087.1 unnamed protein product [Bursaphelenchus okinawaensis]